MDDYPVIVSFLLHVLSENYIDALYLRFDCQRSPILMGV